MVRHEVEMADSLRFTFPDEAETMVATCVGLGIIDTKQLIGRLGHFCPGEKVDIVRFVDEAIAESGSVVDLTVAAVGTLMPAEDDETGREIADEIRMYAAWLIQLLVEKGIPENQIQNYLTATDCMVILVQTQIPKITVNQWEFPDL